MLDNTNLPFNPERISIAEFLMLKDQVDIPEVFNPQKVKDYLIDNSLELSVNTDFNLLRADLFVEVKTDSKGQNSSEASGSFHLAFLYYIEKLKELVNFSSDHTTEINPWLAQTISSITYSTARGILMARLRGTALQWFILPVIDPNKLYKAPAR